MFIYAIVCSESLKLYVGQHKGESLERYLQQKYSRAVHEPGRRSHLYAALRKHPRETWSIWPLVSGIKTREELDALEKHFIRVLKTQHPDVGYNICDGGEGFTGPHSEATREKISKKMHVVMLGNDHGKGRKGIHGPSPSVETRRKQSAALTGRPKSAEHARRIGDGHRGLVYNVGNSWNVGRKQSQATIEKRKTANAGFRHSEEAKQKMRYPKSPETIQRMRDAQQARRAKERQ